ncbi:MULTISPECIES: HD-GYP domain-containing protein [Paenibacillus]|jgi:HD-GYP domain-containing protein (c-di-GMP phosphodiesterase class II)|uniref:HD-GYP domain-containing protein n=1 Tax=Paenibacillus baimaensis TaxID=2982185 RepID=A0ABT2UBA8_9BACL|nr:MULTISPECIES: HD-GYP domain-containing protein [unclassified Paenibacillus]MCU6791872.1 HD-GYP domain-containing protein [Paenibacillus sp. WQ 127069]OMF02960.1 HD family phosphohydrolase [Paenibacillus sp. FSL H7-0331]
MATISVSQLKTGEKMSDNVQTKLGNVLFMKGKIVSEKDIEILKAFLIPSISIESKENDPVNDDVIEEPNNTILPFYEQYDKMLSLLKKVFNSASGQNFPILEVRTQLEALLQHIDQYHILTFSPKTFQLNDYLFHNSIMVSLTSYSLARWHGLAAKDLMPIAISGLLHDIGNAKVDPGILYKPNKLTPVEFEELKQHTTIGYNLLKNVAAINEGVKLTAIQHHEREDGSGYPLGIKGDKIHLYSKIVAISDIFHAMTSDRYHKKAASPYLVLDQLFTESFGKLDPALVQTFIQKVTQFHNGVLVKLNDKRIGEIVFSDRANPTRPWVNVNGQIINLTTERSLYIQDVIQK